MSYLNKEKLREEIKAALRSLSSEEKARRSEDICRRLEELPLFISAETLLLYWSLPSEVATHRFVEKWSKTKTILLPATEANELLLKPYTNTTNMKKGAFNIYEPNTEIFTNYSAIDLCIIPGIAFDKNGNRLGRGKGFYDKLLPKISCTKIGVCFDIQLVDFIPQEKWDEKVNLVIND